MSRRPAWVGIEGDQRFAVDVMRRYPSRVVCRIVEPGHPDNGVVRDFHPGDLRQMVGRWDRTPEA